MKKLLVALGLAVLVSAALWLPSLAQSEGTVTASVTVQNVSVSVSPSTVNYGTLTFEATQQSGTTVSPTFTATNNGNVNEDLKVRGANATEVSGTPFTWTIQGSAVACPTDGTNVYAHSIIGVSAGPIDDAEIFMTTSNSATNLATGLAALGGTKDFNSKIYMPCTGSGGQGQTASTDIIVVAIAS